MGILTEDMKRVVEEQRLGFVATVCADGTPNLSPKGTTAVWDDDHLVFAAIRSPQTMENLHRNPVLEINVIDPIARKGYRFKGRATILSDGELHQQMVAFYEQRGVANPIQALVLVAVERALPCWDEAFAAQMLRPNEVRRRDRAVEDEAWIRALLHRAPMGTLATVHNGQPFINSNLFVYDEAARVIYMHTARVGRTRANVESEERVCFSVSEMGRLLPAPVALEFSVEYAGVVIFGTAVVIEDETEATHGLQLLLDKYFPHLRPGEHYRPIAAAELARTAVYRIRIEQWSGKKKEVAVDFPGAFRYGEQG